jgi:hypothetical protein
VFNVADMAVVFGAIALALLMFKEERQLKAEAEAAERNKPLVDEFNDELV